jgi:hypothetical protein
MKSGLLLILLILLLCVSVNALTLHSTETPGENPSIYGSIIAFETHEDHAGKDLNSDGDMGDQIIQYYDIEKQETINTKTTGKKPSVFAYYIIFETSENEENKDLNDDGDQEDRILQYYNIHEQKTINTEIEAQEPYLYQYLIVFSTPEKSLKRDHNNDGDLDDNVIRYYDLKTKELTTTNQIGKNPSTNGRRILFVTDEKEVKIDLNDDGDQNDQIFQIYSVETKTSFSTKEKGTDTSMNKKGLAVYIENNKLTFYDAAGNEKQQTEISVENVRIKENIVLYDYDNKINTYNIETQTKTLTEIYGQKIDLFETTAVFQTDEENTGDLNSDGDQKDTIIRYVISEDGDDDGIFDLIDNCPTISNLNQADIDNDGMGDECDSKDDREKETELEIIEKTETGETIAEQETETKQQEKTEKDRNVGLWFGIFMILLIVIIAAILIIPKYYRRRKKGFGF